MKILHTIEQASASLELAFGSLPKDFYDEKNDCYIYDYEARIVDMYKKKSYDYRDNFVFIFEIRT